MLRASVSAILTLPLALGCVPSYRNVPLFPAWVVGKAYAVNDRAQYNGTLYKCIQAHTSQADWMPSATPALWKTVSLDEYPEWVQPTGAHDAYNIGDKVTYNGQHYVCTSNANVYAPDVYGWQLEA